MIFIFQTFYANSLDAFTPEMWANEGLAILEENMVMGGLVYRDFSSSIQNSGDTVNTRKPAELKAYRKTANDDVTVQDVSATNIPVKLNQQVHVSFTIKDSEQSFSFKDLVTEYLRPAMIAQARFLDLVLCGQVYQFMDSNAGVLGSASAVDSLADLRQALNDNKASSAGRNLILGSALETQFLKIQEMRTANTLGDGGATLRTGQIGSKLGFDVFMSQNMATVASGNTTVTGAINKAGGYSAGTTSLTVDGLSAAITAGSWCSIAGIPHRITGSTGGATPTAIVVDGGLKRSCSDNDVIVIYTPGAVNNGSGYAVGYGKEIVVDSFSVAPRVGQLVTFANVDTIYTIIDVTSTTGITLDRPLEAAISDSDAVCIGPAGNYGLAFLPSAIALVNRPLALPRQGTGAVAGSVSYRNMSMRVVMTYDGKAQGTLVTLDSLMGVAVLESLNGAVLFG